MHKTDYIYNARVTNVVDGDTVDMVISLGFGVSITHRVRLSGINTQETNDTNPVLRENAMQAKKWVTDKLLNKQVTIQSFKSDKYGRYLADIYLGDELINKSLIDQGLAEEYHGGKR